MVLEIIEVSEKDVIFKVNVKEALAVARYPYLQGNYEYINFTRGGVHNITIVKSDLTTFEFHYGGNSSTCIGLNLERLIQELIRLMEEKGILYDVEWDVPTDVEIFYNHNYSKWQVNYNNSSKKGWCYKHFDYLNTEDGLKCVENELRKIHKDLSFNTFKTEYETDGTICKAYTSVHPKI